MAYCSTANVSRMSTNCVVRCAMSLLHELQIQLHTLQRKERPSGITMKIVQCDILNPEMHIGFIFNTALLSTHVSPPLHLLDRPVGHELRRLERPCGGNVLPGLLLLLHQLRVDHREPQTVGILQLGDGEQALSSYSVVS